MEPGFKASLKQGQEGAHMNLGWDGVSRAVVMMEAYLSVNLFRIKRNVLISLGSVGLIQRLNDNLLKTF